MKPHIRFGPLAEMPGFPVMSASLIGQLGSSAFQAIHHFSVDVSRRLSLLFGIGTKALVWGVFSQEV